MKRLVCRLFKHRWVIVWQSQTGTYSMVSCSRCDAPGWFAQAVKK